MSAHELASAPPSALRFTPGQAFYRLLRRLEYGSLRFTAPDGRVEVFTGPYPGPHADLRFADWRVALDILRGADIGLAESYRDDRLESSDLTALLLLCAMNDSALARNFYAQPLVNWVLRLKHLWRSNTRRQARKNIHAHYDLSNAFYGLWLDPTMTYSSGLFDTVPAGPTVQRLEAGQIAKYERILREIAPTPGEHILEIGCGWGGFAEYAAQTRKVRVTGITLSAAQLDFVRARIARAGLESQVTLQLIDYRDMRGTFDHVVSIEMFEAVGERYWPTYFTTLKARLRHGGRALVQAITIDAAVFPRYRATSDFIREYIFPGGMLAPIPRLVAAAEAAGLSTAPPFQFGADYATTLTLWRDRVYESAAQITALGFDARFQRLWHFYLSYSEAGFRSGRTDVVQLRLCNDR